MSNHAWVCFDCRAAVRRGALATNVRCPLCAATCERLGCKVPIPPRSKIKAWEQLREQFYRFQRARWMTMHKGRVRQLHDLEHAVARLRTMPMKPGRAQRIVYLDRRLKALRAMPV